MNRYRWLLVFVIVLGSLLRLYSLGSLPFSLYWDEASLGYNAWSITESGIDEHGETYPIARFVAFGDYKPPGYIYAAALSIRALGKNEFAIRFPSALAGILLIPTSYCLALLLCKSRKISLLTALIVAISPWSLQLSRGAFEANLATLFNALGVLFFLIAAQKKGYFFLFSLIFFIASFYTFNANRIIAPLLLGMLSLIYIKSVWKRKRWFGIAAILSIILIYPSISYLRSPESRLRFNEVSIFNELSIVEQSNDRIRRMDNSPVAKILFNRRVLYGRSFLVHFFDHFNPRYLFFSGDRNPRFSTQIVGNFYVYEALLLLIGCFVLVKHKKTGILIVSWIVIATIPSAMARETPHALRTASVMPSMQILIAIGFMTLWRTLSNRFDKRKLLALCFSLLVFGNLLYYLHYYFIHYPYDAAGEWHYGYKQLVQKVGAIEANYDSILVTQQRGRPYIYFLLYGDVNPRAYLAERRAKKDAFGLWNVDGYGKYYFGIEEHVGKLSGRVLKVGTKAEIKSEDTIIDTVYYPSGEEAFIIAETK